MVVTTLHKLIGLSVAMLGKAPGTDLLNQWTRLYTQSREDGMDAMAALQKVAQHILDSDAFEEVHPAYTIIENSEFAQRFLNQLLGETASAEVVTLVVGLLNSGTSRAEVAVRAVEYLLEVNHQGSDHGDYAIFGSYAMRFGNQVEVARYYTVDKVWMTPNESVLAGVDDTTASVTAAKSDIDGMQQPGKNFTLTTGVDQFTGTPGDDIFIATEKTLTGADRVDGKQGMDKMELSGSGANADISIPRGATVKGIETLSVSSDGKFTGDVSAWTGLETVTLEVVKDVDLELDADAGIKVTSESLGDDEDASTVTIENAGMVALEGVSKQVKVNITGEGTESVMVKGGKGVKVDNDSVASVLFDGLSFSSTSSADPSAFSTLHDLTVDGVLKPGRSIAFDAIIESDAIAKLGVANTSAHILIKDDAGEGGELMLTVDKFGTDVNESLKIGTVVLGGAGAAERVMLEVAGDSFVGLVSRGMLKTLEVSGAGALELRVQNGNAGSSSNNLYLPSGTLETLMLSNGGKFTMDAKGMGKLMMVDASDATGDVKIDNLGKSVTSYQGSAGKDTVSVAAFNSKGLMADLGDGDDTFTVDNLAAGNSKINGGEGMDTLVLKQNKGANLKDAGDAYRNFETITLEAGQGEGTYDLKDLDIDKLMVSGGTKSGGITFKNVMSGTDLTVSSKMPDSTTNKSVLASPTVSYMLEDGEAGRFGGGDSSGQFTLHLHTNGGKMDKKSDLGGVSKSGVANSKTRLDLTLDKDIETVIVHSTATVTSTVAAADRPKAMDYVNRVVVTKGDGIEQLKVTGDAVAYITTLFNVKTSPTAWNTDDDGLLSLSYVDATESSGGLVLNSSGTKNTAAAAKLEVEGSPVDDWILGLGQTNHLKGNDGDDVLVGLGGEDTLQGGGGGDFIMPVAMVYSLRTTITARQEDDLRFGDFGTAADDNVKDTLVYAAASDSQVKFDSKGNAVSGFDKIIRFSSGSDKIDLSKVADLQGTLKNGNHGLNGASGGGDDFLNTKSLHEFVTTHHKGGAGVFKTSSANQLGDNKHSIAYVSTRENGFNNDLDDKSGTNDNVSVTWILVDVDADGDFDAGTDMAIALLSPVSGVAAGDFI